MMRPGKLRFCLGFITHKFKPAELHVTSCMDNVVTGQERFRKNQHDTQGKLFLQQVTASRRCSMAHSMSDLKCLFQEKLLNY